MKRTVTFVLGLSLAAFVACAPEEEPIEEETFEVEEEVDVAPAPVPAEPMDTMPMDTTMVMEDTAAAM